MNTGTSILALGLVSLLSAGPFVWAQTSSGASGAPSGGASGSAPSGAPGTSGTGVGGPGAAGASGTAGDNSASSTDAGRGATDRGIAPSASPATSASPASGDFMGRHTMTGEVTKVDAAGGKFSLKTGEGTLELHAPPSALAGVKQGDRMTVEIAVKPMK
jgi:hypothetical protein